MSWNRVAGPSHSCHRPDPCCRHAMPACRYMLAASPDCIVCALRGTLAQKDHLVNANFWHSSLKLHEDKLQQLRGHTGIKVHGGFLSRAQSIPYTALYALAREQKKRLVFCGAPHCAVPPAHHELICICQFLLLRLPYFCCCSMLAGNWCSLLQLCCCCAIPMRS